MIRGSTVRKSKEKGRGKTFDITECGKNKQPYLGDNG
jgi:hypothetical protein